MPVIEIVDPNNNVAGRGSASQTLRTRGFAQADGNTAIMAVTLTDESGNAVSISGGGGGGSGGSVTAAGTSGTLAQGVQGITGGVPVPVSGAFYQATQPVSIASTVPVSSPVGAANFAPGQATLTGTTAALIVAARTGAVGTGRVNLTIVNNSTTTIYLGGSGVTSSTGLILPGVVGASVTLQTTAAIYGCLASAGSALVSYYELY